MLADMLAFSFSFACLKEGEIWCDEHAADSAAFGDPEIPHPYGLGAAIPTAQPDPCHLCAIKRLRSLAGSHLFEGPVLQSLSLYESLTSSCGVTGYPLTSDTPAYPTPTPTVVPSTTGSKPSPTCSGTTYTINAGDDCNSIARSQGIGTAWLLIDNNLSSYCYAFPTSGELCLVNRCNTATVPANSTCETIADSYNVTEAQLKAWNPVIDLGCHNLEEMVGFELCVQVPGLDGPYTTPGPLPLPSTLLLTPAPAPTDVAVGTNSTYCGLFHHAVLGEYCNMLVMQYSIPLADFRFLNTAINENCTNLFAGESYCVKPVGDINTYFGRPGITSIRKPTHTLTDDEFATSARATWTMPPRPTNTELPFADDTREDCFHYIDGDDILRADISGTLFTSHCQYMASSYGVGLDEVEIWNPSIGNASLTSCTVEAGRRYCARLYDEPVEKAETAYPELAIRASAHPNCTLYEEIDAMWTCTEILETFGLTIADFYRLNTAVGSDCAGLWPGYRYCVSDTTPVVDDGSGTTTSGSTPTTTTTGGSNPTTTTTPTAPGPTHSGQPANSGDTCGTIISQYSISSADFYAWNPAVDSQCVNNFWLKSAYCVSTDTPSPTTTIPAPTTTSAAPGPTHEGQPSDCNKWHLVATGDDCSKIIKQYGISSSDFYTWNPAIDSQCINNFWGGYAYCVGTGPDIPPTTTTGPLIPHITPPGPTHTGQPATSGDDCSTIMDAYFLTVSEFFSWNPAVNAECTENFWAKYAYCVSIVGHSTRSTIPPATTTTIGVPTPSPVHDNSIISSCNKFMMPVAGDWCALFAERHGVTMAQLGAWNAALGVDGKECGGMFWGGYWYCVHNPGGPPHQNTITNYSSPSPQLTSRTSFRPLSIPQFPSTTANMDTIPPEVTSLIISYLPPDRLSAYASVSPHFQATIERITFSSLNLTSADLSSLATIVTPARSRFVRVINFKALLPEYDVEKFILFETDAEEEANSTTFSEAVEGLFGVLSTWEGQAGGLEVQLEAGSPVDPEVGEEREWSMDILQNRWSHTYLRFQGVFEELPMLRRIRKFTTKAEGGRRIEPATLAKLAARMEGLEEVRWDVGEEEVMFLERRLEVRRVFGAGLVALEGLKRVEIAFAPSGLVWDHSLSPPRLGGELTQGLRKVLALPTLETFLLGEEVVLGADLFLPVEGAEYARLRNVYVSLSTVTEDGEWYLDGEPGDEEPEELDIIEDFRAMQGDFDEALPAFEGQYPPSFTTEYRYALAKARGQDRMFSYRNRPSAALLKLLRNFVEFVGKTDKLHTVVVKVGDAIEVEGRRWKWGAVGREETVEVDWGVMLDALEEGREEVDGVLEGLGEVDEGTTSRGRELFEDV
ncbi:hypothetical protein BJ508DRAFT_333374 [Ascobolus immersus RN42]|uniref:LysM domain-containing protein n=1 Tax=Ascobolus immersus RN42 TaxID=1160509 RepID=A0A3N4HJR5_ASCIM|nr:hypothetical protein BJ508DRAFT_333374 [Ascobolus immersus RN42]